MIILKIGITLCLFSFASKVLGIYITSNDTLWNDAFQPRTVLDIQNTYNIDPAVDIQEKRNESAETCNCRDGKCVEKGEKMICTCPPEYGLYKNKNWCIPCKCGKESNCTVESAWYKLDYDISCICKDGYKVVKKKCVGPCTNNPCLNGGECKDEGNSFKCHCKKPFSGSKCETVNPCSSNPCKNMGTCSIDGKSFKCDCQKPYYGTMCEKSPCSSNPCLNNGSCIVGKVGFICSCKAPFTGKKCELELDWASTSKILFSTSSGYPSETSESTKEIMELSTSSRFSTEERESTKGIIELSTSSGFSSQKTLSTERINEISTSSGFSPQKTVSTEGINEILKRIFSSRFPMDESESTEGIMETSTSSRFQTETTESINEVHSTTSVEEISSIGSNVTSTMHPPTIDPEYSMLWIVALSLTAISALLLLSFACYYCISIGCREKVMTV